MFTMLFAFIGGKLTHTYDLSLKKMLWRDSRARMRGTMKPTKAIQKVWRRIFSAARIFNIILPCLQVGELAQRFEVGVWTFILQKS